MIFCVFCTFFKSHPVTQKASAAPLRHIPKPLCQLVKTLLIINAFYKIYIVFCRKLFYESFLFFCPHMVLILWIYIRIIIKDRNLKVLCKSLYTICAARAAAAVEKYFFGHAAAGTIFFYYTFHLFLVVYFIHIAVPFHIYFAPGSLPEKNRKHHFRFPHTNPQHIRTLV